MDLLDKEQKVRAEIFEYFGYVEDWRVLPFDNATEYFWKIDGENVLFGSRYDVVNETGDHYENEIYTQRHLNKWVYEGSEYTMILVDTHTDGNKFLQIFDNSKRLF